MMGIPTYGRVFQLTDSSLTVPGSPNSGAGNAGAYTQEAGVLAYYEVTLLYKLITANTRNSTNVAVMLVHICPMSRVFWLTNTGSIP